MKNASLNEWRLQIHNSRKKINKSEVIFEENEKNKQKLLKLR